MIRRILTGRNVKSSQSHRLRSCRLRGQRLGGIECLEHRQLLAGATVYTVNSTTDTGTGTGNAGDLRYVINQADADTNSEGSVITFDPTVFASLQTITLGSTLTLSPPSGPIVINGPTANVVISGNGTVGVFAVATGATASLTGLTIAAGSASTIGSATSGGGLLINPGATVTLTNDNFNADSAVNYGGAVYNNGGTLSVTGSTFVDDTATNGLGAAIDNAGALTVASSTFTGGVAFQGGAIDNKSGGSLVVTDSSFSFNVAIMGGAIFNNATATVYGSTMANNTAVFGSTTSFVSFDGGAIANDLAGVMTLTNSTIANNAAAQAGGGIDTVGVLTAVNDTIAYNTVATGSGGGVYAPFGTTTLDNTIVALNTVGTGTTATPSDIAGNLSQSSSHAV